MPAGAADGTLRQHFYRSFDIASDTPRGALTQRVEPVENLALIKCQSQWRPEDPPHVVLLACCLAAAGALDGAIEGDVDLAHGLVVRDSFARASFFQRDLQILDGLISRSIHASNASLAMKERGG